MGLETYYDERFRIAIDHIHATYGDTVSVFEKRKLLRKFGRFDLLGTSRTTIMEHQGSEIAETYVSTNVIDSVVTDDASYNGTVYIEGHTISGGLLTFVTQTKTLTNQTAVTLDTPLARVSRLRLNSTDTLGSSKKIYVYESSGVTVTAGVPQTASKIHITMNDTYNTSQKASTSVSSGDYWLVSRIYASVLKKANAFVDFEVRIRNLSGNNQFYTETEFGLSSTGKTETSFMCDPFIIVPANSDVIMTAVGSTTGIEVVAGISGYLAKVI